MAEPMTPQELDRNSRVLRESRDAEELASSAVALAASEDAAALQVLSQHLPDGEFLSRLDDLSDPAADMVHLTQVFRALAEHPAPATARVCQLSYAGPEFHELPARINLLLAALAAVRPVSPEAAEIFRSSSREGYAEVNGPLLIQNESPLALQVFHELIAGDWVDPPVKIQILHRSVLPKRTNAPVLNLCARLLDDPLAPEVRHALIETLFDYQSRRWFGPVLSPPVPPPWETASTEALDLLIRLADRVLASALEDRLRNAVQFTREQLQRIRAARAV